MQNVCESTSIAVMTFKSGKFILSSKCDFAQIMPLIVESSVLYSTIRDLPVLPNMASQLDEDLMMRSIHGTVAIEGNPLPEDQVDRILTGNEPVEENRAVKEILNLKKAYNTLPGYYTKGNNPLIITQSLIKEVHNTITYGIEYSSNEPGKYRNHRVEVGDATHGGKYVPPKVLVDIQTIMNKFEEWSNTSDIVDLDPFLRSALVHFYIGAIHPFADGNGRTARFIEAACLSSSGYKYVPQMLSNFYYKNVDDYYTSFRLAEKTGFNDITPFIKFVLTGVIESLNEIKSRIVFHIRDLALMDYLRFLRTKKNITQRQFDLIQLIADSTTKIFTRNDIFSSPPFDILYRRKSIDTFKRDMKRLLELDLLIKEDDSYRLNYFALG